MPTAKKDEGKNVSNEEKEANFYFLTITRVELNPNISSFEGFDLESLNYELPLKKSEWIRTEGRHWIT